MENQSNQQPIKPPQSSMDALDKETRHILTLVIVGALCFVVLTFVFAVGIFVGQKRAEFSFNFAENYHRNFGGPMMGVFSNFPAEDFMNSHGLFGKVLKIDGNAIVLDGQNNVEQTIIVSSQTIFVSSSSKITIKDININDTIVVIGSPNDQGQIEAKFIRVLPSASATFMRLYEIDDNTFLVN